MSTTSENYKEISDLKVKLALKQQFIDEFLSAFKDHIEDFRQSVHFQSIERMKTLYQKEKGLPLLSKKFKPLQSRSFADNSGYTSPNFPSESEENEFLSTDQKRSLQIDAL